MRILTPVEALSGKERAPSRSQPTSQELKWEESRRARKGPSSSSKSILAISIAEAVGDSKSRTLKPRSTRPAACLPAQLAYVEVAIFGLIAQQAPSIHGHHRQLASLTTDAVPRAEAVNNAQCECVSHALPRRDDSICAEYGTSGR